MASQSQRVPKSTRFAAPNKLRQLQYRSYIYELVIYHYPVKLLSLRRFEAGLGRRLHGFVARLVSDDPIASIPKPEGDEIPDGFYEVAYLKNIFQNRGCALGFRVPRAGGNHNTGRGRIEWFCFEKSMQNNVDLWTVEQPPQYPGDQVTDILLFDKVAILEKGPQLKKGTVRGNREHREWYQALERATYPQIKLKLTWRSKEMARKRELHMSEANQAVMSVQDEDFMENRGRYNKSYTGMDEPMTPESTTVDTEDEVEDV